MPIENSQGNSSEVSPRRMRQLAFFNSQDMSPQQLEEKLRPWFDEYKTAWEDGQVSPQLPDIEFSIPTIGVFISYKGIHEKILFGRPEDAGSSTENYIVLGAFQFYDTDLDAQSQQYREQEFMHEVLALDVLSRLNQPFFPQPIGVARDTETKRIYFITKRIGGEFLNARINRTVPNAETQSQLFLREETALLSLQLLLAAGFAHKNDITHRDIKPENIIIKPNGVAVLLDWEGCYFKKDDPKQRRTYGTHPYAAPEQSYQQIAITPQADIHALGIVLFEMFHGMLPITYPPLTNIPNGMLRDFLHVHPHLGTVIAKATAQQIEARYQTIDELRIALIAAFKAEQFKLTDMQCQNPIDAIGQIMQAANAQISPPPQKSPKQQKRWFRKRKQ